LTTYTRLGTTRNRSTTANLLNSQITTAPAKHFSSLLSSPAVSWQLFLTVEIFQLHTLKSYLAAFRAELNYQDN
jgi:hypothetical protein